MNYTLNQLYIFAKVVENESITKAAEVLHLTQPAVSIQLKNFQDQFETPLTEVVGRKLYITDFGHEVAQTAKNILEQVQTIHYKNDAYKGLTAGRLKIAVVSTGKYVMPYFLSDFLEENSAVQLQMDVTNRDEVLRALEKNEIDLALVSVLPKKLAVNQLDLFQNELYLVGNRPPADAHPKPLSKVLRNQSVIFRENGSATRKSMEHFISKKEIPIAKKMILTSNEAIKQAVLAGLGYSIMPYIGLKRELDNKELHIIPVKGLPIITNWSLIWLKGKKHTPATLALLDYIDKNKKHITKKYFGNVL